MPRIALTIPPGSGRRATPQDTRGAWWDMSLVRWDAGELVPVGGWKKLPGIQLDGSLRSLLSWRDNEQLRWVAAATLSQIQVWDGTAGHVVSPPDFRGGVVAGLLDGYGIGNYGAEEYGTHRSREAEQFRAAPGDSVSLDNWGENLLAMGSGDGRLLQWAPVLPVGGAMAAVAGAPLGRAAIVTDERHVVILGADADPRRVRWCSQELLTDWAVTATNTAGSLQLRTTGAGLAMRRTAQGVLIWADDDVHLLQYVGPPFVYGLRRVGSGCGPGGSEAMVAMTGRAVWWGLHGFWLWDGNVSPLPCPLTAYLQTLISPVTRAATYGYHNAIFPEVTWGFCGPGAQSPNLYVTWNYETNQWWHGKLDRSIGCEPGAFGLPLLGDSSGFVYQHETGYLADGAQRGPAVYAETGDLQLGDGDLGAYLDSIVPDLRGADLVQFRLFGQWEPQGEETDLGTYQLTRRDGIIDTCLETRSLRFRVEGVQDGSWALGRMRLEVRPGAGR